MRKFLTSIFAVAALAAVHSPAAAGEVTIRVSADGLNFTHAADIATMKDRIDIAVRKACAKPTAAGRHSEQTVDECVADGTAKALAEFDAQLAAQS